MLKQMTIAAMIGAFSIASLPALTSVAMAQGTSTEPPSAPTPSEAMKGGGMMKKDGMKGGMKSSKKMKKHKKM